MSPGYIAQTTFYALLDQYSGGDEPLENWTDGDLLSLIAAVTVELMGRVQED